MVIGDARSIPLDAARKTAQTHWAAIVQGRDPAQERREHRNRKTVAAIWAEYTADQKFTSKSAGTQYKDRNRYSLHVADRIGSKFVDELGMKTVEDFINAICSDKRTGRRGRKLGGDGAAKKVLRLLSTMTAWALKRGLVKVNPFIGHALRPDGTRTEIVEGAAFRSIFSTLDALEVNGRLPTVKARALRVLWATGARRSEITGLRWRHVRLDDERIVFGSDEHKGGTRERTTQARASPALSICRQSPSRRLWVNYLQTDQRRALTRLCSRRCSQAHGSLNYRGLGARLEGGRSAAFDCYAFRTS